MTFFSRSKEYVTSLLDFIYPESCYACEEPLLENESHICVFCKHNLYIGQQLNNETVLLRFAEQPVHQVFGLMRYLKKGLSQELINKVKYFGEISLGFHLGQELGKQIKANKIERIDFIIPVPLHKKKLKVRGYNQAEVIARGVADILDCPIVQALNKVINNSTQTKKGRISRWRNADMVYELRNEFTESLKGKNILIIDDVLTSGATLTTCIKQIEQAGVAKKYIGVLAIAELN
jgi:ComF family protein